MLEKSGRETFILLPTSLLKLTEEKCYLLAGIELSERICVMGISMNLVTYLVQDLHLSSPKSANVVTNFMGTLNLLGLLGGFMADAKLGRYATVAISGSITALVSSGQNFPSFPLY